MKLGPYELKFERRITLSGWEAAGISILAILVALVLFSLIFILADINPLTAYKEIFTYAFANPFGIPLTVNRFIFLMFCTLAFILPSAAGLWNIGMAGQLYSGALFVYAVLLGLGVRAFQVVQLPVFVVTFMLLFASILGGAALGGIAGYLKGKFNINEIVVTMMLNFMASWIVSYFIKEGGPFMNPGGRGESFELPPALHPPLILDVPYTLFLAIGLAVFLYFLLHKMKIGYQIRAYGESPNAAAYAGISKFSIPVLVFVLGGALAGLAGYHYFAAVPGVYKIARNYSYFGDLAFYGIICGLISQRNPLAAIPVALLFGGLSIGGRFVQGKLGMSFGVDFALLGVLMITLVGFQFFYRYRTLLTKTHKESLDAGVLR
jgi:simple sugar transport system permease protein